MSYSRLSHFISVSFLSVAALSIHGCGAGSDISLDQIADYANTANPVLFEDDISAETGSEIGIDPLSEYIECKDRLPCVWSTADSGVSVTLEAVGSDSATGRLEIAYTLQTTRDTRIRLMDSAAAVDSSGDRYSGRSTIIGTATDSNKGDSAVELLAGIRLTVKQVFREVPTISTRSIARFTFEFIETGVSHKVGFLTLPLDSETGQEIDCDLQLPCTWFAVNDEYSVTVILAEGLLTGRLMVHYQIDAYEDIVIKADPGSIAIGNEGTTFNPKIHTLGDTSDYQSFESTIFEDATAMGTQSYFRTTSKSATKLKKLILKLSQVGVPGPGTPVFTNLPLN